MKKLTPQRNCGCSRIGERDHDIAGPHHDSACALHQGRRETLREHYERLLGEDG